MSDHELHSEASDTLHLATDIVAAYVSNNKVSIDDLPSLMADVFQSLQDIAAGDASMRTTKDPAVPISKSVTPEFVICLEDGKKLKMLKRHLMTAYGMTPDDYRQKWGLKPDYPMVAPSYAAKRQQLAKKIGLGRKPNARGKAKAKAKA